MSDHKWLLAFLTTYFPFGHHRSIVQEDRVIVSKNLVFSFFFLSFLRHSRQIYAVFKFTTNVSSQFEYTELYLKESKDIVIVVIIDIIGILYY